MVSGKENARQAVSYAEKSLDMEAYGSDKEVLIDGAVKMLRWQGHYRGMTSVEAAEQLEASLRALDYPIEEAHDSEELVLAFTGEGRAQPRHMEI